MSFKAPANKVSSEKFADCGPIITPRDLKTLYFFGIPLTDEEGNEMPNEVLQHFIDSAVDYLEHKLDIIIKKRQFTERYDYRMVDYTYFNFLSLKHRPINDVEVLKAKFPQNKELIEYPKEWYVIEKESGQLQLSPVEGTFSGLVVTQGGAYLPLIYGVRDSWPHLFEATYSAGFDHDKIPKILNEMIGMQAAIRIFEVMGDIILGPGVSSESVGLDGANTSKTLTASATFSAFSARIESYKKQMKDYIATLRQYYNGIPTVIA